MKQIQAVSMICFTFISDDGLKYSCKYLARTEVTGDDMDRMHSITTHHSIAHIVFNICHFVYKGSRHRQQLNVLQHAVDKSKQWSLSSIYAYSAVCGRTSALRLLLSAVALAPLIAVK